MSQVQDWNKLHPVAKLVIKILQHVKSKMDDVAEVRVYFDNEEITITTHISEIRITPQIVEFKRRKNNILRVQRAKVRLPENAIKAIKNEVISIVENDVEPDYQALIEILEKTEQQQVK